MSITSTTIGSNLRETPGLGAHISRGLGHAFAAVAMWRERSRQRRQMARCAALLGHRFVDDTLIGRDEVPSNPSKPFWGDAILVQHPAHCERSSCRR